MLLLTCFFAYKYSEKHAEAITNGYNYLILSLFALINSIICLPTSIIRYYYKFHNIKDIALMLIVFYSSSIILLVDVL